MPLSEAAGPDARIWSASGLMECPPTWISLYLSKRERRQVFSFPSMKSSWERIFCFLEVPARCTWWEEVKAATLVRWRGHWPYLSQASMTSWSSGAWNHGCAHGWWIARLLLLIVRLESLDSVTSPSIAAWIRRNHWGCDGAPSSSTRTVEIRCSVKLIQNKKGTIGQRGKCAGCSDAQI